MARTNRYIAIIPARGGSKRLPGKNLLEIAGKPLIAWTIEAALNSDIFDRVIVSTDSKEIADAASSFGAEIPFMRPAEISTDKSTTVEVFNHALKNIGNPDDGLYTHFACLQPTSPLRIADDICGAAKMMESKNADAVISVCRNEHSPLWSNILPEDKRMDSFLQKNIQKTPSQELPAYYRLNGAMYFCDVNRFLKEQTLFLSSNIYAYEMSRKNSIDIDDEVDFDLAGIYLSRS
jgi:CMP-N-acetylneuraminic acid synthetase